MKKLLLSVIASIMIAHTAGLSAQNSVAGSDGQSPSRYEQAIRMGREMATRLISQTGAPGLSVAVAVDGSLVWSEGFGFADMENRVPVRAHTRFRVGSLSKLLTAATAARLYEQGLLDLDAPVQRYVPAFPKKEYEITIRQLAGHLGGIRHYKQGEYINHRRFDSVVESLKIFQADELVHQPGAKYLYSTYGYTLISAVIEGAAKQDFLTCVQQQALRPINMKGTIADDNIKIIEHRVRFYSRSPDGQLSNEVYTDNSERWAAGGFLSTAEDLAMFGSAHLKDGFLKPETRSLIFTSQRTADGKETSVGIGWRIGRDSQGRRIYHHGGDSIGGRAFLIAYPDSRIVVALLANLTRARFAEQEATKFAELFMN
ncbi:MAG: serine hydrolase domain-containing protein [Acidobacteriota bacterium]